jgi:hypothetical protein
MRGESFVSQSASLSDLPDDTSKSVDTIHGHTIPPFAPSVRRPRCSQVGQDVRRQNAPVRRYAPRVIRTKRAQQSTQFPGITHDVLAPLHITLASDLSDLSLSAGVYNTGMLEILQSLMDFDINTASLVSLSFIFGVLFTLFVLMILEGIRHNAEAGKNLASE